MVAAGKITMKAAIMLLFFLNFIWLYTYFIDHPIPVNVHFHLHQHSLPEATSTNNLTDNDQHLPLTSPSLSVSKSWPILPSYLPWSQSSDVRLRSCEAYFGNGFTRTIDLVSRPTTDFQHKFAGGGGWFRCHYSETLRSSICEGGGVRMNPERIRMSNGGEKIEDVMGRKDEDELPIFEAGAFQIVAGERLEREKKKKLATAEFLDAYVPQGEILRHTMRELIDSVELVGDSDFKCSEWVEEPTLLLTRFEYANVFHTYTDWYSAYVSSRVTGLPRLPHVVFVDGHATTRLEEMWDALFSSHRFAKNFISPVCFRHAIFTPLGYETALFKGLTETIDCDGASARYLWANPNDSKTARLSEFGEMITSALGFPADRPRSPDLTSDINILFVRREDYLAHPRHGGKVESRLSNEQEVFDSLSQWVSNHSGCKLKLVNGLFAHMPMKEQIRAIRDASVIIGRSWSRPHSHGFCVAENHDP
ncbi:hypothetical protein Nepgr_016274 [Nepenthes gracilis]|uniref:Uncharacterized protein n=1 Tax=Nepenthes gracilis TaxID=150966 RepID=A0AAD3SMF0_NEPGR|nr:hypothetical protein Nepgr_016274 [Nepenthes gracilis]